MLHQVLLCSSLNFSLYTRLQKLPLPSCLPCDAQRQSGGERKIASGNFHLGGLYTGSEPRQKLHFPPRGDAAKYTDAPPPFSLWPRHHSVCTGGPQINKCLKRKRQKKKQRKKKKKRQGGREAFFRRQNFFWYFVFLQRKKKNLKNIYTSHRHAHKKIQIPKKKKAGEGERGQLNDRQGKLPFPKVILPWLRIAGVFFFSVLIVTFMLSFRSLGAPASRCKQQQSVFSFNALHLPSRQKQILQQFQNPNKKNKTKKKMQGTKSLAICAQKNS